MHASTLAAPTVAHGVRAKSQYADRLRQASLRVTDQRVSLLAMLGTCAQPVTIEQIHELMGDAACDLVTIYRTVSAFEKAGIVYRSGFSDRGAALYTVASGQARRYPVVRRDSATVEHLDEASAGELQAAIDGVMQRLKSRGYGNLDYIVEFFVHEARS
ncbi:MAG: transcriptional repressor [Opitutaceae bacterium]|nr:transcriptional repressor [Opitutaceae bacterium]